ncbi:unnamed protein product [Blepharisma stoltei]|uniref:Uncharacterized protein n=1 Tax=Blepharisma stoltei TaxID=1481888 RepID=A0AAU9JT15_9CILI|nr:unnamed protein product [Blepharisma stoltei]
MGRTRPQISYNEVYCLKRGHVLFKPKHIKSKDKLLLKYKNTRKCKKEPKRAKLIKPLLLKSARKNVNQCLQSNGKLLFAWNGNIVKLNLKSMKTVQKNSSLNLTYPGGVVMCAIPDQKFFCVDCWGGSILVFDIKLNISIRKSVKPRLWGTIIYLNGLIYEFLDMNKTYWALKMYDLKTNRHKKVALIKCDGCSIGVVRAVCAVFEEKIAFTANGSVRIFDPFCNSCSEVLKLDQQWYFTLLVANDKLYCIQSHGHVFESIAIDFTQWICIGRNTICYGIYGLPLYSLYDGSIYFVGAPVNPSLYEFNLKTRKIVFIDHLF